MKPATFVSALIIATVTGFPTAAAAQDIETAFDGSYRVRGFYDMDPDLNRDTQPNILRYFQHRLRLEPKLYINERVRVEIEADAFPNQVWGSNPGNLLSQTTADASANLIVTEAFGAVTTPVGELRVGRMDSDWGLGILSNDGDGYDNDFGDSYFGDTYDRILFVTKPMGVEGPLTTAALFDQIVETDGVVQPDPVALRGDVNQVGIILFYKYGNASFGTYSVYRWQSDTETGALIPDIRFKYETPRFFFDSEIVGIYGQTEAVTAFFVPGQEIDIDGPEVIQQFELAQPELDLMQLGFAAETEYKALDWLTVGLDFGYASGDDPGREAFSDGELSAFSFDPDYNVGLLMFEYANRIRTQNEFAAVQGQFFTEVGGATLAGQCVLTCVNTTGFPTTEEALDDFINTTGQAFIPSRGAVRNAIYAMPKLYYGKGQNGWQGILGFLWATAPSDITTRAGVDGSSYGYEVDLSVLYQYTENFRAGVQAGYLLPGDIFEKSNGETESYIATVQPRFTITF